MPKVEPEPKPLWVRGPQGYAGSVDYRYSQDTDYHYTTHDGDARPRPTGFGA